MTRDIRGLDPVAQFQEVDGDIYFVADEIGEDLPDDYVMVNVVNGNIYLAEVNNEDPYWQVNAEVSEGPTGDWSGTTDKVSTDLPQGYELIDILGTSMDRFLVYSDGEKA